MQPPGEQLAEVRGVAADDLDDRVEPAGGGGASQTPWSVPGRTLRPMSAMRSKPRRRGSAMPTTCSIPVCSSRWTR
jgi:hypothetical protein